MRVTNKMMMDNAIGHMNDNLERLSALQEKASTGKVFQNLSDDPGRAATALSLRTSLKVNQNYLDNDAVVNDWLSANESQLGHMMTLGTRANNLVLQGIPDTMTHSERAALATELDEILVQAVDIANSRHNGKYIFAGFRTKSPTPPFTLDAAHSVVTANDDTHSIQLDISPGQTMTTNFIGSAVFDSFFRALVSARDALSSDDSGQIQAALATLQSALDPVATARTTNGARQRQLNLTMDTMESTKIQLKSLLSSKEDVNMAEAISQLRLQETTYESVIQVSQRSINTINLFDVLR